MIITSFIESLYLGHYERITQCPDILRKNFKYVVELPSIIYNHNSNHNNNN